MAAPVLLAIAFVTGVHVMLVGPEGIAPPDAEPVLRRRAEAEVPVFAYATLTSPLVRFFVTLQAQETTPARLPGYTRRGRDIDPDPGGSVAGVVFDVTPAELRRLDLYERVGERYERIRVRLADGTAAWAYRAIGAPR
jgi:hypothetical protein